ncbi:MAG: bifunctional DNA primase/polymerase [Planctomycetia bacterium]|nr:bifunctional DNA primase/polymerase [Planctomycetia bacterium]
MKSTLNSAIKYIQKGWSVIPIPQGAKGPTLKGWPTLRIAADRAEGYFDTESNIGVLLGEPSGNLVCIDLDHDIAVELAERYLPPTGLIAGRTLRLRKHWFYRVTGELKSKSHKLPDSGGKTTVEILSDGRQVVVGPSIHPTGDEYDELDGEPVTVDAEDLSVAVGMIHAAVIERLGLQESPVVTPPMDRQPSGTSNGLRPGDDFNQRGDVRDLLRRHGWRFVCGGENEHWGRPGKESGTSATLKDGKLFYNFSGSASPFEANRCYGPFGVFTMLEHGGDFSAATVALRAAGYGESLSHVDASGLLANATSPDADEFDADDLDDVADGPLIFPTDCLMPSGLLGDVVRHNLETALYPQPQFALGGALALLAVISGRKITDTFGTQPNAYILSLGPSGAGKDHARQLNKQLLQVCDGKALLAPDDIESKQGLIAHLATTASKLFQIDEFHRLLATMSDPKTSPHLYGIGTALLTLYSASRGLFTSGAKVDVTNLKEIDRPNCCVLGTGIPDGFWENLTAENLSNGLVGRFMLFEGGYIETPNTTGITTEIPATIIERIKAWLGFVAGSGNLSVVNPTAIVLPHTDQARTRHINHLQSISTRRMKESAFNAAIWSRSGERAAKLALAFAASRWDGIGEMPTIELGDVDSAIRLSNYMTRRLLNQGKKFVAENKWDGKVKNVLRIIADNDGISKTQLSRKTQGLLEGERDAIIRHLLQTFQIFLQPQKTGGRTKTTYTTRRPTALAA